jgi:hypothetical protein
MVIIRSVKIAHRHRSIYDIEQRVSAVVFAFLSCNFQFLGEIVKQNSTRLVFVKRI